MSGTASTSLTIGGGRDGGYGGYRPPFTAGQWQELEHQAMIYKYLVAGLPVPPDLVMPIRHSFDAISARLFHHPSLGYVSYYGKKFDPEPGRCRRTDGKKWRCSKDAHPDSKYCERHMHRGRNRSRKPVESQSTSQSSPAPTAHISSGPATNTISFQTSGSGSFQNMPLYSVGGSEGSYGGSISKLQMENISFGIDNKELRYIPGLASDSDDHTFPLEASSGVGSLGAGFGAGSSSWRLMPSQVSSTSVLKSKADSLLRNSNSSNQQDLAHAFDPMDSKQRLQHCFLGNDTATGKQEQHPVHPFFSEWPTTKESWSVDVDDGADKNIFSSTQLSISIPRGSSDFSSGNAYSQNSDFPNPK